ncbi:MAG: hypothetical protein FD149_920 [Rhodospirillaceae bacterium]|nr:MAG: hypothetical protein FD149_920 [Rhodospirillaceae bacterium]
MELSVNKTQQQQSGISSLPRAATPQNAREAFATVLQTLTPGEGFLFAGFDTKSLNTLVTPRATERPASVERPRPRAEAPVTETTNDTPPPPARGGPRAPDRARRPRRTRHRRPTAGQDGQDRRSGHGCGRNQPPGSPGSVHRRDRNRRARGRRDPRNAGGAHEHHSQPTDAWKRGWNGTEQPASRRNTAPGVERRADTARGKGRRAHRTTRRTLARSAGVPNPTAGDRTGRP